MSFNETSINCCNDCVKTCSSCTYCKNTNNIPGNLDFFSVTYTNATAPVVGSGTLARFVRQNIEDTTFFSSNLTTLKNAVLIVKVPPKIKCVDVFVTYTTTDGGDPIVTTFRNQEYHYYLGYKELRCDNSSIPATLDIDRKLTIVLDTFVEDLNSVILFTIIYR